MPLYGYKCKHCDHEQEKMLRLADWDSPVLCHICDRLTTRQITANIQRDEPTWLADAVQTLVPQGDDIKRPVNRTELNRYMKENNVAIMS